MTYRTDPGYDETYNSGYDSGYEEGYESEPDAREYINTVKSVFLAILKLITGLIGLALIILVIVGLSGLAETVHNGLNSIDSKELRDALRNIPWDDFTRGTGFVAILFMVIAISHLLSMAMNGIGAFLLRVAKHGATPVQIAHIVYTVFGIIRFVLWCVIGTLAMIGLIVAGSAVSEAVDIKAILGDLGAQGGLAVAYVPTMIVLIFMLLIGKFLYHLSVSKVMSHTRKELSQGRLIALPFYNKLPGRCIFLVVVYGIMFTLNAVLFIVAGSSTNSMSGALVAIAILAIPLALHYLRLFLVMGCAKDFSRAHE